MNVIIFELPEEVPENGNYVLGFDDYTGEPASEVKLVLNNINK